MAPKPIDVQIRSVGVDGVRRDLKLVSEEGANVGEKFARSGRSMAGVFLEVARSGELGGRELKEVVREGGEMATMFGEAGPIIGGVVLLGVALYEAFSKGKEQVREMERAVDDLNSAQIRLTAETQGNRLGVISEEIAAKYRQEFAKLEKEAPGWGTKIGIALSTGMGFGPDFFGGVSRLLLHEVAKNQLQSGTYGAGGELDLRTQEERRRRALADAGGFAQGTDPVERYRAQLRVIELEKERAVESGELSEEAADARAAGKREALVRQGYDVEQKLGADVANALAKLQKNVFDQRQGAEDIRYHEELDAVRRLTISEKDREGILDQIRLKHSAITAEIAKQRRETEAMGHAQAQSGSLNPIEQVQGQLAAIEMRKKKSIEAGTKEVDAARIAEAEKRDIFMASVDAAVRSNASLAKIATKLALDPLISYLEGLAISEGIKAIAHFADFDLVGGSLHAAAATAALAGAHEIAALAGGGGGGGRGGSGGGGGLSSSGVSSSTSGTRKATTIVIKGGSLINLADPHQRDDFVQSLRDLYGDGDLNFIFE